MNMKTRIKKAFLSWLGVLVAFPGSLGASTGLPAPEGSIQDRVIKVQTELLDQTESGTFGLDLSNLLAQWGNWGNWNNWNNWADWFNWNDWNDWYNWWN